MSSTPSLAERFRLPTPEQINREEVVLVIEAQQDVRMIVTHHLNKLGFRGVKQCANGMEAIEWMQARKPNEKVSVILCSMEMPVMSGLHVLAELRDNPELERGPFVITMENPSREKIMLATENGSDEILVKPFALNDVIPKLTSAFRVFHNPKNPEKVYELAKTLLRQNKLPEATKVYEALAEDTAKAARPYVGLAYIAMSANDLDGALARIETAIERNPNFVPAYSVKGEILVKLNQIDDGIVAFRKAIELSPLNPYRYVAVADPLFSQKRYQEAVEILSIAEKNNVSFPKLNHYMSQAYFALQDFKRATRHVRAAIAQEPNNIIYLNQLGICYKEQKMFEEANKTYNSIIKLNPNDQAALYNKAILLRSKGDLGEAVKLLERLISKHPDFDLAKQRLQEFKAEKEQASKAS